MNAISQQAPKKTGDAARPWDVCAIEGIYQKNCSKIRAALKRKEARIDRQVMQEDEHHYLYGDYNGWYHQAYDERMGAYVSGAYEDKVCAGDTALIIAVKTGDISVVSTILEFKPNIEITNIDGMRAADYARRNGLKDLLNDDGVDGVTL
eukprot:g1014.t1